MANDYLLEELCVIGAKVETTQNTAAAPTSADFFLASDVEDPVPVVEFLPQEHQHASLDQLAHLIGQVFVEGSFKIPHKGSGTAGTAHGPLGAILQSAGNSETVVGGTSVTYAPVSVPASANFFNVGKSMTVEVYRGGTLAAAGLKYQVKGAVVTKLVFMFDKAAGIMWWDVTYRGLYVAVADAVVPAHTYLAQEPAVAESLSLTLHTFSPIVQKLSIDFGLTTALITDGNSVDGVKGFKISKREPTGSLTILKEKVATFNSQGIMYAGTSGALGFVTGAGDAGNIGTFAFAQVQVGQIKRTAVDGLAAEELPLRINISTGNDWWSLIQT